jgi:hypothetical protein
MERKSLFALQIVLGTVCLFHIGMGAGLNFSSSIVDTAADMYGANVEQWSPQFLYILRPLGLFMFALGIMAGVAALKPVQYRATIYIFAGIFIVRAIHRIVYGEEISQIFGIAGGRNVGNMMFFFGLAAVLIVLDQLAHRTASPEPATAS